MKKLSFFQYVMIFIFCSALFICSGCRQDSMTSNLKTTESISSDHTMEVVSSDQATETASSIQGDDLEQERSGKPTWIRLEPTDSYAPSYQARIVEYAHSEVITKAFVIKKGLPCDDLEASIVCPEGVRLLSDEHIDISQKNELTVSFQLMDSFDYGEIDIIITGSYMEHEWYHKKNICLLHEGQHDYTNYIDVELFAPYSKRIKDYYDKLNNDGWEIVITHKEGGSSKRLVNTYNVSGYINRYGL